jgi:hypothetical protein
MRKEEIMLIEFIRAPQEQEDGTVSQSLPISINPRYVSAVTSSVQDNSVTIVRLADGRGFIIAAPYAEVMGRLNGAPELPPELREFSQ